MQKRQDEWKWQWNNLSNKYSDDRFLFQEWIFPNKIEDFKGKKVLDCGCGGGQHLRIISPFCKEGVGIDLNTAEIAKKNNEEKSNLRFIRGDISTMNLKEKFDIAYSIGVLHHTDNPTESFNNIKKFVKRGGKFIIWVYSYEGNFLNRTILE